MKFPFNNHVQIFIKLFNASLFLGVFIIFDVHPVQSNSSPKKKALKILVFRREGTLRKSALQTFRRCGSPFLSCRCNLLQEAVPRVRRNEESLLAPFFEEPVQHWSNISTVRGTCRVIPVSRHDCVRCTSSKLRFSRNTTYRTRLCRSLRLACKLPEY